MENEEMDTIKWKTENRQLCSVETIESVFGANEYRADQYPGNGSGAE